MKPFLRISAAFLPAALILSGCAMFGGRYSPPDPDQILPVVAISSFDNRSGFSGGWQLGSGMADILVSELMASENFIVVERGQLKNVVQELDLQGRPEFRKEGKVKTGNLKNAQYIIRGVINDFSQVGGSSLGLAIKKLVFGGKGHRARVSLTLTVIEVESGQILESVQCQGIARAREAYVKGAYKGVAFGGDAFFRTPLGEATAEAIGDGVEALIKSIPTVRWKPMVASMIGGKVVINGGTQRGLEEGQMFDVYGEGKAITDPETGDLLSVLPGPVIGSIRVVQVSEKVAFADRVSGSGFERGMQLKLAVR